MTSETPRKIFLDLLLLFRFIINKYTHGIFCFIIILHQAIQPNNVISWRLFTVFFTALFFSFALMRITLCTLRPFSFIPCFPPPPPFFDVIPFSDFFGPHDCTLSRHILSHIFLLIFISNAAFKAFNGKCDQSKRINSERMRAKK